MVAEMTAPAATEYTADEMMNIVASRELNDGDVVFVGIGIPSTAANLARLTHAPGVVLVYESGTIGAKPHRLPLSIGDGDLAETATAVGPLANELQGVLKVDGLFGADPSPPRGALRQRLRRPQHGRETPSRHRCEAWAPTAPQGGARWPSCP